MNFNLPEKENFKRLSGTDAITGASNFDICEYIILKLIEKSLSFELLDSGLTKAKSSALDAIQKEIDYTDLDKLNPIIDFLGLKDGYVS